MSYHKQIILQPCLGIYETEVFWAYCICAAGVGGGCQHVVAVLFTLDTAKNEGGRLAAPESCTSLKRSWVLESGM